MSRKKILWLCSWYPGRTQPFNGDFIQRQARAAALYNDVYVIHITGDVTGEISGRVEDITRNAGLTENLVYYKRSLTTWGRLTANYRWLLYTRKCIRQYITHFGKPDLVHINIPMKMGIFGIWLKKKYGIPFIVTEHWGIYNNIAESNYTHKSQTFKRYTTNIFLKADKFISPSRFLAEGVNEFVTKKTYEVVPNVVDTELFFYQEHTPGPAFRFIHISNMVTLKNAEGILRAFKIYRQANRDCELIMVGDTDPEIRRYATTLGLDRDVRFRGEIPYTGVAKEMQGAQCLILFSDIENSPCVIGEALCCGLPVIATQVGGIPELLNETNGLLITPRNDAMLAAAMERIRTNYSDYNREMIAENARGKFNYMVIGKQLDDIYSSVEGSL